MNTITPFAGLSKEASRGAGLKNLLAALGLTGAAGAGGYGIGKSKGNAQGMEAGLAQGRSEGGDNAMRQLLAGLYTKMKDVQQTGADNPLPDGMLPDGMLPKEAAYTPFATLEKSASPGGLANLVQRGLKWGSGVLGRSGGKAKAVAGDKARLARTEEVGKMKLRPTAQENARLARAEGNAAGLAARESAGNWRIGAGRGLGSARRAIEASPGLQKGINYGGLGLGLVGANRLGHGSGKRKGYASGMEQGAGQGYDLGLSHGVHGAVASQPGDPGFLGRLKALITGNQEGPSADQILSLYGDDAKSDALAQILGQGEYA